MSDAGGIVDAVAVPVVVGRYLFAACEQLTMMVRRTIASVHLIEATCIDCVDTLGMAVDVWISVEAGAEIDLRTYIA
ncbi:DUF5642 family protein [Mycobacterium leprae]|uniref:DUF5642 family protein n=1 Tax=Mycobacterium leprae TaxID=1769 RepID=UPI0013EF5432|nr:DUF5642 family protein [Mycobacterium leprae]